MKKFLFIAIFFCFYYALTMPLVFGDSMMGIIDNLSATTLTDQTTAILAPDVYPTLPCDSNPATLSQLSMNNMSIVDYITGQNYCGTIYVTNPKANDHYIIMQATPEQNQLVIVNITTKGTETDPALYIMDTCPTSNPYPNSYYLYIVGTCNDGENISSHLHIGEPFSAGMQCDNAHISICP